MQMRTYYESDVISPGITGAASREALDLWHNPENILDMCEVRYDEGVLKGQPDSRIGRRLHVSELELFGARPTLADFSQDFPAIGSVLNGLREKKYDGVETEATEFLCGFTLNYLLPGQWLRLHRDLHRVDDTPFGAIALLAILQGEGATYIQSLTGDATMSFTKIHSKQGDRVGFVNPPGPEENRPLHTATATGNSLRINIGLQIPLLPQYVH